MQFAENNGSQQNSFICSDHFHESCFVIRPGAEGRRLKDDAVPSIFQTFPSYYQKDIKLRRSPRKRQYVAHERKKFTNAKQAIKQAICHGCGPVIPILTFVLTGDVHRSVYASGCYGDSVPGWLQNTILLGMGTH